VLFPGPLMVSADFGIDSHTFLVCAIAILVGVQVVGFGVIARHFAAAHGLLPRSRSLEALLSIVPLERGLMAAMALGGIGLAGVGWSLWQWALVDFGALTAPVVMRVLTFALVLIAIAVQLAFSVFLLGVVDLPLHGKSSDADA
jgi:hypothetical protein